MQGLDAEALLNSIIDQLMEIESDLGLCYQQYLDEHRPEIQRVISCLQVANMIYSYSELKVMLRSRGYKVHRLGVGGEDVVVSGYCGVVETTKGLIIF